MFPSAQSIFHITHVDNLEGLIAAGGLSSDREMASRGGPAVSIGMADLKGYRFDIEVPTHAPLCVADFVPFYFCARSVMLYVIYRANHPGLAYRGGQGPIVHLRFDLAAVIAWADAVGAPWVFTLQNATSGYAQFRNTLGAFREVGWDAVGASNWADSTVKEKKQAEFLVFEHVPWELITEIAVHDLPTLEKVETILHRFGLSTPAIVRRDWYY